MKLVYTERRIGRVGKIVCLDDIEEGEIYKVKRAIHNTIYARHGNTVFYKTYESGKWVLGNNMYWGDPDPQRPPVEILPGRFDYESYLLIRSH